LIANFKRDGNGTHSPGFSTVCREAAYLLAQEIDRSLRQDKREVIADG